ncbi:signal recognition particle receptor beta subunit-domain-containing protein [Gongronella butleri]|nr:signal recognition particle receptor beta subunit-domain-containing protein [Gongronella butleri]
MLDHPLLIPGIALSIVAVLIFVVLTLTKKPAKNLVLVLGTTDAGKTCLFTLLRYGQIRPTVTSMKENEGALVLDNKTLEVVDIPGHERLRSRYTDFLNVARCIVFVVDSTTVHRNVRPVAEYLYHLLANPIVQAQKIPLLIVCNKQDMITALPKIKVQNLIESEINRLRSTRTAGVEKQGTDEQEAYLGYEGEAFVFDHVDNVVDFAEASIFTKKIDDITQWIQNPGH